MIREFIRKYRWYLIGIVCIYIAVSLWLLLFTDSPQNVPFVYQVN